MKKRVEIFVCWLGVLILSGISLIGQDDSGENEKALRYHQALVKRPARGYLFDRFFNAWLEKGTVEQLQGFLESRANSDAGADADRLLLGYFFVKQGKDDEAIAVLDEVLKKSPNLGEAWVERARILGIRRLDFAAAVADLDKALATGLKPDVEVEVGKLKGRFLVRDGKTEEALAVWRDLLEANPADELLHEDLVELLAGEGLMAEAIESSQALVAKTRDAYEKVLRELRTADLIYASGDLEAAIEAYSSALAKTGAGSWIEREILTQIERVFRRGDDLDGLKSHFEELVKSNPGRIGIQRARARLLADLDDGDGAIEVYQEILEVTPGERTVREAFIDLLGELERSDEAIGQLMILIELHREDAELELRLAKLFHETGDKAAAETAVARFLEKSSRTEFDYLRAARYFERVESREKARDTFDAAIAAFPESLEVRETKAAFLHRMDEIDEAIALYADLGRQAGMEQALRIARALVSRRLNAEALDLLKGRLDEFENDFRYLGELIAVALRNADKGEATRGWVRRRVLLAEGTGELEKVLAQAVTVYSEPGDREALTAELSGKGADRDVRESCLLASMLLAQGDRSDAVALLEGIVETSPEEKAALLLRRLATIHEGTWEFGEAAKALERLIGLPGERTSENFKSLVGLYVRAGLAEDGLRWVPEWKKLSPGSSQPWLQEARLLQILDRIDEATEVLRTAARRLDPNTDVRSRLADYYRQAAKPAEAMQVYWGLYEDAEETLTKLRQVKALYDTAVFEGQTDRLIEAFQARRRGNRGSVEPLFALAEIYRIEENWEARRDALLEASRLKPDDLEVVKHVASSELETGDWESALTTLESARAMDKTSQIAERMARIQIEYGDPEKGYRLLAEVASAKDGSDRTDSDVIVEIAVMMAKGTDWETAVDFLEGYLGEFPDDYRIHYLRAVALEESFEEAEAIQAFLAVAGMDREIPEVEERAREAEAQSGILMSAGTYYDRMRTWAPEKMVAFMEFWANRHSAYRYRQASRGYYSSNAPTISPPDSVTSANRLAVIHLTELVKSLEKPELNEILEDFKRLAVPMPEVLLKLEEYEDGRHRFPDELLAENPDDRALHALWLTLQRTSTGANLDRYEQVYDLLEQDYPRIALQAGIQAAAKVANERSAALFEKGLALAASIEKPDEEIMRLLGESAGMFLYAQRSGTAMTAAQKEAIGKTVRDWYPKIDRGGDSAWILWMLVYAEIGRKDVEGLVDLLNTEVRLARESKTAMQSPYYSNPPTVGQIGLPPAAFERFPGGAGQMFPASDTEQNRYAPNLYSHKEILSGIDLSTVEDPFLKLLILNGIEEREDEFHGGVAALLEADDSNPDALLLAAGLAEKDEDFAKAAGFIEKARQSAKDSRVKRLIDGALIFAAQKTGKENETVWNLGRKAAIRSMNSPLTRNESQKKAIIAAMETLGLHSEAKRQSLALSKATAKQNSAMNAVRSQQQKGKSKRVEELLERGDREQALKVASKDLRRLSRDAAATRGYGSWYNPLYYLRRVIQQKGIADEVLDLLESENKTNLDRWLEFAYACDFIQSKERAQKAFEHVLEADPQRHRARAWLALNRFAGDDDQAEKAAALIFAAGDETQIGAAAKSFLQESERNRFDEFEGEIWIAARESAAAVLEKLDPEQGVDVSWAATALSEIEQARDWGSIEFGHVHDLKPVYGDRDLDSEEFVEMDAYRFDVHRRLCLAMMRYPSLAKAAFISLAPVERKDENAPEWEARALAELKSTKISRPFRVSSRPHFSRMRPAWRPSEFLLVEAHRRGDSDFAGKTLFPLLEKTNQGEPAIAYAKLFADLLACPESEFSDKAGELAKLGGAHKVIWVWELRDFPSKVIAPFVESTVGTSDESRHYDLGWTFHYADVVFDKEGLGPVLEMWDRFADRYFGEETDLEARRKKVKDLHAAAAGNRNVSYNAPEAQLLFALMQFAKQERFLFPAFRVVENYGYQTGDHLPWHFRNGRYFNYYRNLRKFLDEAPIFTESLDDFESALGIETRSGAELFLEFVEKLRRDAKAREIALEAIREKPDSFGKEFVRVLAGNPAASKNQPGQLYALIGRRLDEFKSLPDSSIRKWLGLFDHLERKTPGPPVSALESPAREGAEWLREKGLAGRTQQIAEFLAAKQSTDVAPDGDDFEKQMMDLVRSLAPDDREKAKQIFRHGWGLIRQRQKTRGWDGLTSYNGWKVGAELLDRYFEDGHGGLEQIGFYIELQREDVDGRFPHSGWSTDMKFPVRLRTAWDRHGGPNQLGKSVEPFLKDLCAEVGDGPVSLLALPFYEVTGKIPHPRKIALIAECDRIGEDPELPHAGLAREWAMASRFYCAANLRTVPDSVRAKIPGLESWEAHALASLRDESVGHGWRVPLACFYPSRGEFAVTDDIALESANVLATAMEKEADFNGWNMLYILRAFTARQGLEGWDEIANRLRAAWWKKNRFNGRPRNTDMAFDPVEEMVVCNLDLHLRLGDTGAWKRFSREFSSAIEGNERAMMMLVEYGQHESAREFLKKYWRRFDGNFYEPAVNRFFVRYSPERHAAIEKFLPLVEDPDLRFFAECVLRAAPDPRIEDKDPDKPLVGRGKRLKDLAQVFKTHPFQDESIRQRSLEQLLLDDLTIPILAGDLAKAWENLDPGSIPGLKDYTRIQFAMRAPAAHALHRLQKGDPSIVTGLSEKIAQSSAETYFRREAFEHLAAQFMAPVRKRSNALAPADFTKLLPGFEAVLECTYENKVSGFTNSHLFIAAHILSSAMSEQPGAAARWRKAQPESTRKLLLTVLKGKAQGVLAFAGQTLKVAAPKIPKPVPAERRIQVVTAFLGDPVVRSSFTGLSLQKAFDMVITKKLLSEAEILERGEELVKVWPRQGFAAAELASIETERGNLDEALRWIGQALETSGPDNLDRIKKFQKQKTAIEARKKK